MERTQPIVAVFGSSQSSVGDADYQAGTRCGRALAESGFAVATGGYGGLMEAVSAGAAAVEGEVIGVTAPSVFPGRSGPNRFVTQEIPADGLVERIHLLVKMTDASISLHGSLGTLTELVVAWNLAFVARYSGGSPNPVVTVGPMWADLVDSLSHDLSTDRALITCVASVEEAIKFVEASVA